MNLAEATLQLDRRVERARKERPDLEAALDYQSALVREMLAEVRAPEVRGFPLSQASVIAKVRAGTPLLHGEPVFVDVLYAADLFGRLLNLVSARAEPDTAARVADLVEAATDGRLRADQLFGEAFVQHQDHLQETAERAGVDGDLLVTLSALAVGPLLRAYAARLAPALERADDGTPQGAVWHQGYCPICGGWPILAELRGVEMARFLRCSGCAHGWKGRRLACPYCGTDDHEQLRALQVEGDRRFKVDACDRCRGYLKSVNAFDPAPPALVALDDAASLYLDLLAMERDYARPPGTGFRVELALAESEWAEDLASMDLD